MYMYSNSAHRKFNCHKNSVKESLSVDIEANGDQFEEDLYIVDALPQFIY